MNAPLPTPTDPTPPLATAVPVVPATQGRILRQSWGVLTEIIGGLLVALPTMLPDFKTILPGVPDSTWQRIGVALLIGARLWKLLQTANSAGKTELVNFSEGAGK